MTAFLSPSASTSVPPAATAPARSLVFLPSLGFIAFGLFAFAAAALALWRQPELLLGDPYRPEVLAFAHTALLGWVSSVVFGAGYQIVPVLAGTPLWSRSLPWVHLVLHLLGTGWMVLGFLLGSYVDVSFGGALVLAGFLLFALNQQVTASRVSLWEPATICFTMAVFWLVATGAVAAFLLANRQFGLAALAPHALVALHAHFGLAGFLLLVLLGASFKLVPMFLVTSARPGPFAWMACLAINIGVAAIAVAELGHGPAWHPFARWSLAMGIALGVAEIVRLALTARRRPGWDLAIYGLGMALFLPVVWVAHQILTGGATWAGEPRAGMRLYFSLAVFGPFALAILGLAPRIVPFLVWQIRFADRVGYEPVPTVAQLTQRAALPPLFVAAALTWGYLAAGQIYERPAGIALGAAMAIVSLALLLVTLAPALRALALAPSLAGRPAISMNP